MDPPWPHDATSSSHGNVTQEITGNHFGNNNNIHQGNVVHNHWPEDEAAKCLLDLRITDPRDDKLRIERTKGGLLKDSYKWILEHSDFQQWRDNDCSRLLWIKGDPGKGKTMLLCGITDELSLQRNAKSLVCYFFCQAADSRINSATAVLRGLIYLAIEQRPMLISHVLKKYKHGGDTLFNDINAWTALSEIFSNILNDANLERTFIIIDALDECTTDLPNLLDFISTKSALFSQVKWIVSSRNWPDIEDHLDPAAQKTKLCLELNESSISEAVNIYIKHKVEQLAQKKAYGAGLKDAIQHQLSSRSNNTFLWVALVCQNLEKISLQNTLQNLNEFPPGLDSLYERMIKQIHHLEDVKDASFCFQILATVLLVYQPVTLAELGHLVESPDRDPADINLISRAIGLCGSFLTIRDEQVYIIHQSAKDYLNKTISTFLPLGTANIHGIIFLQSLSAMSAILQRNIYNLDSLGISANEIKAPDPDPLKGIHYSCIYWANHFCDMHYGDSLSQQEPNYEMSQMILPFLQKYFLYWLEALGLTGHMMDGVLSIIRLDNLLRGKLSQNQFQELSQDRRQFYALNKLKKLFQKSPDQSPDPPSQDRQLLELIQDSRRFIQHNSWVIANNPLQAYASALIFSPSNSLIRKLFQNEEPNWLKVKPIVDYDWSPCLQTLEGYGHPVNSVAFSLDGYVASGSKDGTIKIWDATTGKEQQTLEGHSSDVKSVAFSAGGYLASGSNDRTIKIWDITTGKEQQTLKGHSDRITSVAFSVDGYLASGSIDTTIKIWDITTGKERQTLDHSRWVTSVAFSIDGHLASSSSDKTTKIWDTATGKERKTIMHNDDVCSVAFSANGRYLALGLYDSIIKIWDTTTGKKQQTLKGHDERVISIAFSKDNFLASGSADHTIKIWDIITGKEQRTIQAQGTIYSIALSADDRYLASGLDNGTTKIWDMTIAGKERQVFKGHGNYMQLALSKDGRHLASGSYDIIWIWDTTIGKEQRKLEGHGDRIATVAFSADGRHLASGSWDHTVKIWDAMIGKKLQTLRGHSDWVTSVSFSADGHYLASGANNGAIKIWDAKTRKQERTLRGHRGSVDLIAFSADSRYLASWTSNNKSVSWQQHYRTITIWDMIAGKELQILKGHSDGPTSTAFSADNRYLATGSRDGTLKVWATATGRELQTINVDTKVYTLSFDETALYLHTEIGPIKLDIERQSTVAAQVMSSDTNSAHDHDGHQLVAEKVDYFGYGLSLDKCWITWSGRGILWLPPEYRPTTMSAIWPSPPSALSQPLSTDTVICLSSNSGILAIMRMSSTPYSMIYL